jgi:hypothetical protein
MEKWTHRGADTRQMPCSNAAQAATIAAYICLAGRPDPQVIKKATATTVAVFRMPCIFNSSQ